MAATIKVAGLRDRISWLLTGGLDATGVAETSHPLRDTIFRVRDNLIAATESVSQLTGQASDFVAVWSGLPRRGAAPQLRFIAQAALQGGGVVLKWEPWVEQIADMRTCHNLMTHNFGLNGNEVRVEGMHTVSNAIILIAAADEIDDQSFRAMSAGRNLVWATGCLQRLLVEGLSEVGETHLTQGLDIDLHGHLSSVDHVRVEQTCLSGWLKRFQDAYGFPASYMAWFHENRISPAEIRDISRTKFTREMAQSEARACLDNWARMHAFNDAWWSRGLRLDLPEAEEPAKIVPHGKKLVRKEGARRRVSPVAERIEAGSSVVPRGELRTAIKRKIAAMPENWHFTAGDFAEFVARDDRSVISEVLARMKERGQLTLAARGVYASRHAAACIEQSVAAHMRDRGEAWCASFERAAAMVMQSAVQPESFYTAGQGRLLEIYGRQVRLTQEPFPGLCRAVSGLPDAPLALATLGLLTNPADEEKSLSDKCAADRETWAWAVAYLAAQVDLGGEEEL